MPLNHLSYNSSFLWSELRNNANVSATSFGPFTDSYSFPPTTTSRQVFTTKQTLASSASYIIDLSALSNFVCEFFEFTSVYGIIVKPVGNDVVIGGGSSPLDPFGAGVSVVVPNNGVLNWFSVDGVSGGNNFKITNSSGSSAVVEVILLGEATEISDGMTEDIILINGESGSISICTPVYVFAADTVKKAQANASGTTRTIGFVSQNSIAASASGNIRIASVLQATTGSWDAVAGTSGGLTAGTIYYLSDSSAGHITSTAPSTSGHYVQEVGEGISATELLINIKAPIEL